MNEVKPCFVLDACALLRVAQGEPGMEVVRDYLYRAQRGECDLLMHQINLGEVVYRIGKIHGWKLATHKRAEIERLPIIVVAFEEGLFWAAVELKARHPMSYADTFAAALALERNAALLTADPEFAALGERLQRIEV